MNLVAPLRCAWPWPLPALAVWLLAWVVHMSLRPHDALASFVAATSVGGLLAWRAGVTRWRTLMLAAGFPLSALLTGHAAQVPPQAWLVPLVLLAALYPIQAWRDAPLFPTPREALAGLAGAAGLAPDARVLDAGCGAGHGLQALEGALRAHCPQMRLEGIERSWPLRGWCAWRCRFAQVRQGDMWRHGWHDHALVYLFQRPETMSRAWAKACAEMRQGGWLVSLEFAVPDRAPDAVLPGAAGKPVWMYRIPAAAPAQPAAAKADMSDKTDGPEGRSVN